MYIIYVISLLNDILRLIDSYNSISIRIDKCFTTRMHEAHNHLEENCNDILYSDFIKSAIRIKERMNKIQNDKRKIIL